MLVRTGRLQPNNPRELVFLDGRLRLALERPRRDTIELVLDDQPSTVVCRADDGEFDAGDGLPGPETSPRYPLFPSSHLVTLPGRR